MEISRGFKVVQSKFMSWLCDRNIRNVFLQRGIQHGVVPNWWYTGERLPECPRSHPTVVSLT